MAQKITGYIKLQIPAGKATPAPPVGPALIQTGKKGFLSEFCFEGFCIWRSQRNLMREPRTM